MPDRPLSLSSRADLPPDPGVRSPIDDRRLDRWRRIGLGIRLAYNPSRAEVIRLWLAAGRQLARDRVIDERTMLTRTLGLLLTTAEDPALPWGWRILCLDHVVRPGARLQTLAREAGHPPGTGLEPWLTRLAQAEARIGVHGAGA